MENKGHSEDYFTEFRDYFWNADYIELLAKRFSLNEYSTLLDVGCGKCHWSGLLGLHLKKPAQVVALDSDPKWAKGNNAIQTIFANHKIHFEFCEGDVYTLPFPDESFDVVTCQTVLIHLDNPLKALTEMKRVLKKGGRMLCVEPNNLAGFLVRNSLSVEESIDDTLNRVKFRLIYEKGKKKIGEGDASFGDFLSGHFAKLQLQDIATYQSDKCLFSVYSPYDSVGSLALIEMLRSWLKNNEGAFDYKEALAYFKAVSEEPEHLAFFERQWKKNCDDMEKILGAIEQGTYYSGGGFMMYIVSGIKS